jgi:hypothetical protein
MQPEKEILQIRRERHAINDALVAVEENVLARHTNDVQRFADLAHERINALTENAVHSPAATHCAQQKGHHVDSINAQVK